MAQRPWQKNYPSGVSLEIDPNRFSSLAELIRITCRKYADLDSFVQMGVSLTFRQIDELSDQFASYLQNELGMKKGDRLGIQLPNVLQYPVALFGALKAGVIVVNTNPLYTPREMEHQYSDSGCVAVIVLANFASKIEEIQAKTSIKHVIVTELGDFFPPAKRLLTNLAVRHLKKMVPPYHLKHTKFLAAMELGKKSPPRKEAVTLEDIAFLQYTGGTTGVSKAAVLTHRNVVANLLQMVEWMRPKVKAGHDRVIAALPLYHVFSLSVNCLGLFSEGLTNILIVNPRDIPALLKEIEKTRPQVFTTVNTLLVALLRHPMIHQVKFEELKLSVAGGMALQSAVAEEWLKVVGSPVIEGYGLTEASPVVSCNPLSEKARLGTIGLPVSSTDVKIVDEAGQEVKTGEVGEIWVQGPQVMREYWNQPAETSQVLTPDRWLKTGDLAKIDTDGFLQIVDRKKEMILVSGFNVYPNEIEGVVMRHPGVAEVAAIGVPDPHSGEVVKIFIVPKQEGLTEAEIKEFCRKELTAYKAPKFVEFRKELPKNNVGKILRRLLREQEGK